MKRIRKTARNVLFSLVILVSVFLIVISLVSRVLGYVPCGIHDDSMEPVLHRGSLVLAKPIDFSEIQTGDILVFSDPNSSANFARVVREVWPTEQQLVTSSASSQLLDPMTTAYRCVVGKVQRCVPYLGYPAVWVHTIAGKIILALLYIFWIAVEIEVRGTAKRRETSK